VHRRHAAGRGGQSPAEDRARSPARGAAKPRIRLALALCGVLAPFVFTVSWVVAGFLQAGYNARREDISALAAADAERAWVMIAGIIATGLLTAAFGVGIGVALGGRRLGPAFVIAAGLGIVALGVLRNDCSTSTETCAARIDAGDVSWQHTAHDAVSIPVLAAAVAAPLVLAWSFRADPRWLPLVPISLVTAPTLAALFALGGVEALPGWEGIVQRVAVSAALVWLGVAALHLLRLAEPGHGQEGAA
jgi:hypothetical protein